MQLRAWLLVGCCARAAASCAGLAGLDAWLCGAAIHVDDIELDESVGGLIGEIKLSIRQLTCTGLKVGQLTTSPHPLDGGGLKPTFDFSLTGLAT